jgi:hypothetical protein
MSFVDAPRTSIRTLEHSISQGTPGVRVPVFRVRGKDPGPAENTHGDPDDMTAAFDGEMIGQEDLLESHTQGQARAKKCHVSGRKTSARR